MRLALIVLYTIFIFLLLPWISVALWVGNFLNDAIVSQPFHQLFTIRNTIFIVFLLYPIFVIYGAVSSWYFLKMGWAKPPIILNALTPLLSIVLLLIGILFFGVL